MSSTIVQIHIDTTKRIKAFELLYKQFLCLSLFSLPFLIITNSQP